MVSEGHSSRRKTRKVRLSLRRHEHARERAAFRGGRKNDRRDAFMVWLLSENRENRDNDTFGPKLNMK